MAQSMFKQERPNYARKTWRTVLIGAAVPLAVLAAAPAVGATETVTAETVNAEQLPGLPAPGLPDPGLPDPGVPDVQALLDLQLCLADLQAALSVDVDVPAEAEQLPLPGDVPGLPTDVPDVAAMNETCQAVLAIVLADVPPVDPPVEVPVPDPAG
ncbi:hypothetical protein AB0B28_12710 [Glycomyces sp. NPDC046736]|uniref:hypothetical protein n=1 Tax=Glycomyces sp. NPDC046736 TaxID=3155615 RepID=UPI0033F44E1F